MLRDLEMLRDWHRKSLYNAPADMKHNGYVCFYCLKTTQAGDVDPKHVIEEGAHQPSTLSCQKCDIDSVLTKEALATAGMDIGSSETQMLLEQLHLAYFRHIESESSEFVQATISYFKRVRNPDLSYSHSPEDLLNHIKTLRSPTPTQPQQGETK